MKPLFECVPNISEGRRDDVISEVIKAITDCSGTILLDRESDANHNRSVLTFIGDRDSVLKGAFMACKRASEIIDLNHHKGEHPRMGACDVIPFVPLSGAAIEDCIALANDLGEMIGEKLKIPVFLYEAAAKREDRKALPNIRKGEFEGLREEIGKNPDRDPDFGPRAIHPTAGAVAVGAREFLIAYNINLKTEDVGIAKKIAKAIREKDGGLPGIRSLGFFLEDRKLSQVSINVTNYKTTGLGEVFSRVLELASDDGISIEESEIVGLAPADSLINGASFLLKLNGFNMNQVLERKIEKALEQEGNIRGVSPFLEDIASKEPIPGGGSVSALLGALSCSLIQMVCNLTIGKKKYEPSWEECGKILGEAKELSTILFSLISEDSVAYKAVVDASKLPTSNNEEARFREESIETATKSAIEAPLKTMESCAKAIKLSTRLTEIGNKNCSSDAKVAILCAEAGLKGANLNVEINLPSLRDEAFVKKTRERSSALLAFT